MFYLIIIPWYASLLRVNRNPKQWLLSDLQSKYASLNYLTRVHVGLKGLYVVQSLNGILDSYLYQFIAVNL